MKRRTTSPWRCLSSTLALFFTGTLQAAAPANDVCSGAVALSLDAPVAGTTAESANQYQLSDTGCFSGPGGAPSNLAGADVVYSFTAPSAGSYSFRVSGYSTSGNLALALTGSCPAGPGPNFLQDCKGAANRLPASSAEEVACVALGTGQQVFAFVDEDALTAGSDFTVEVNRCVRESSSNDTTGFADPIACGGEGFTDPTFDVDFYSLGINAAGSRLFALVDTSSATTADLDLRVTTNLVTLEYDDADNTAVFGATAPNVAGVPLTSAAAFLRVSHFSQAASGPYRFYSVVQPASSSAAAEAEPNEGLDQADTASGNYFAGQLSGPAPSSDVDIYGFGANAGDLVFLSLDADPLRDNTPIDAALAILDPAGNLLLQVDDTDAASSAEPGSNALDAFSPTSPAEGLVLRVAQTGNYYAQVSIGTDVTTSVGAGDYLLSIARSCVAGGGGFLPTTTPTPTITATPSVTQTPTLTPIPLSSGRGGSGGGWLGLALLALLVRRRRLHAA